MTVKTTALLISVGTPGSYQAIALLRDGTVFRRTTTGSGQTSWRASSVTSTPAWVRQYLALSKEVQGPDDQVRWQHVEVHETEQEVLNEGTLPDTLRGRLSDCLSRGLPAPERTLDKGLADFFNEPEPAPVPAGSLTLAEVKEDLIETVIDIARGLRSEDGENPEYDRALIEMGLELCGYPTGEHSHRRLMAIAMGIKGQRS